MKKFRYPIVLATMLMVAACSKNDQQGNASQPQATAMLTATNRSVSMNTVSKDSIVLNSATAQAASVKFEAKSGANEIEYKSSEQRTIDLLSATSVAGNFNIPAGVYNEVEIRTLLEPLGGQPSLQFKASYTSGGSQVPLVFTSLESLEVKGEKENVTVDAGSGFNILTLVDMGRVLNGISSADLNNASRVNGEIVISSTSNPGLCRRIVENLRSLKDECEIHHH